MGENDARIEMPGGARRVAEALEGEGFEAYLVGGAVRDALLGAVPDDADVATSALADQASRCLEGAGMAVHPTGIAHGTITAVSRGEAVEVTTFRVDGPYSDSRHPDSVRFTRSIEEDLARRDFTINAMAYSEARGLIDPFGGREDLRRGIVRCVGSPKRRFEEDALRIMRALRFASKLGFSVERETAEAIHECAGAGMLQNVAAERLGKEFVGLLCGREAASVLRGFADVVAVLVPEIVPTFGLDPQSPYHVYDVWEHTLAAMDAQESDDVAVRVSTFFHDLGKGAAVYSQADAGRGEAGDDARGDAGNGASNTGDGARGGASNDGGGTGTYRFEGHDELSAEICARALRRLRCDGKLVRRCRAIISAEGLRFEPDAANVRGWMRRLGTDVFFDVLAVKRADMLAHSPEVAEWVGVLDEIHAVAEGVVERGECVSLPQLAVNGGDLVKVGFEPGPGVGAALDALLDAVVEGELPNERDALLQLALARKDDAENDADRG